MKDVLIDAGIIVSTTKCNVVRMQRLFPHMINLVVDRTKYLPIDCSLAERLYHISNDLEQVMVCSVCDINPRSYVSNNQGYRSKCNTCKYYRAPLAHTPAIKKSRKERAIEKYGVDDVRKTKEWQESAAIRKLTFVRKQARTRTPEEIATSIKRRKATLMELYGVEHALHSDDIKNKARTTMEDRYGGWYSGTHDHKIHLSHIADSKTTEEVAATVTTRQNTMMERYGAPTTLECSNLAAKANATSVATRGVELRHNLRNEASYTKFKATMVKRHGAEHPSQSPTIQAAKVDYWIQKYGVSNPRMLVVEPNVYTLLEDQQWLTTQYKEKPIYVIAEELGVDDTTVNKYIRRHNIPLINHKSRGELEVLAWLHTVYTGLVMTNNRTILKGKELDIYLPEAGIAIEYCGVYWHCDAHSRITPNFHQQKTADALAANVQLFTIFEDEWKYQQDIVKSTILHRLKLTQYVKIHARNCKVVTVSKQDRKLFLEKNHILGDGRSHLCIGLQHANELVAVAAFCHNAVGEVVLNRMCVDRRYSIPGAGSKLLSEFKNLRPEVSTMITFCDLRWSTGESYRLQGWLIEATLPCDYQYTIGDRRYHKFNFRRANISRKLKDYDPSVSEIENCRRHRLFRIWNCGMLRLRLSW